MTVGLYGQISILRREHIPGEMGDGPYKRSMSAAPVAPEAAGIDTPANLEERRAHGRWVSGRANPFGRCSVRHIGTVERK